VGFDPVLTDCPNLLADRDGFERQAPCSDSQANMTRIDPAFVCRIGARDYNDDRATLVNSVSTNDNYRTLPALFRSLGWIQVRFENVTALN